MSGVKWIVLNSTGLSEATAGWVDDMCGEEGGGGVDNWTGLSETIAGGVDDLGGGEGGGGVDNWTGGNTILLV